MGRFDVNVARSYVGCNVNLHLKGGTVVVNVHIIRVRGDRGKRALYYETPLGEEEVPLEGVDWAQLLDPFFGSWNGGNGNLE